MAKSKKKIIEEKVEEIKEVSNKVIEKKEISFKKVISTGSTLLDLAISGKRIEGGGIPGGIVIEIFGPSSCVDGDTEFFSPLGWKKISEYNKEKVLQYNIETGLGEFVTPIKYIKEKTNFLYHFKSKLLDQCLSPNHMVLYKPKEKPNRPNNFIKITAQEMVDRHEKNLAGFQGYFITSFKLKEKQGINVPDIFIRIAIMSIADGTFPSKNFKGFCSLNIKKQYKKERAIALLKQAGISYTYSENKNGYLRISYYDPIVNYKEFPPFFYECNNKQFKIIAEEVTYWDGDRNNAFFTTFKNNADFIQTVFTVCGKRASMYVDNRKNKPITYTVRYYDKIYASITNKKNKCKINKIVPKDGFQYCFQVPSENLVLRRNNRIFITGNSGKSALLSEISASSQINKGETLFIDPEARLDAEYAKIYGMELKKDNYYRPDTVKEFFKILWDWETKNNEVINVCCADSLAALSTELEMGDEDKMGMKRAKDFSEGLRKTCRIIAKNKWIIVCSNQEREGATGAITPGGKAIPYYSSLRIRLFPEFKGSKIKKSKIIGKKSIEKIIGIRSKFKIVKSSIDEPYREGNISIIFGYGIDDIRENLMYLKEMNGETKYICPNGQEYSTIDKAIEYIEENNLQNELKEGVIKKWNEIEEVFKTTRKQKTRV